jgi:hypothetical protein
MKKRGKQISFNGDNTKPISIGFEDIDNAIKYYFENIIQPSVIQNGQRINVPIIYGSQERWKSYQKDGYYRDKNGKIMLPIIMFKKENIEKLRNITSKIDANFPYNMIVTGKKYSRKNTYSKFNLLNNIIPQETFYATVVPDYVEITYKCIIQTYYIEQLNKLIESINYTSDSYWGDPERFKFKASINNYSTINEITAGEERIAKSEFQLKIFGYIVPDIIQKDTTSIKKFNNKTKTVITFESTSNIDEKINHPPSPSKNIKLKLSQININSIEINNKIINNNQINIELRDENNNIININNSFIENNKIIIII